MIYEPVAAESPIQQGDLFRCVPRVEMSLSQFLAAHGSDVEATTWQKVVASSTESGEDIRTVVKVKPVLAVAITQNCDAARARYICLCEVDRFLAVTGQKDAPKDQKRWQSLIIRMTHTNPKLFYLPPSHHFGIDDRMAVDFRIILRIPRVDLEAMRRDYRVARLNSVAMEHFRESLAFFFRRYAYNEWYPLSPEELQAYQADCPEPVDAYPWQKQSTEGN